MTRKAREALIENGAKVLNDHPTWNTGFDGIAYCEGCNADLDDPPQIAFRAHQSRMMVDALLADRETLLSVMGYEQVGPDLEPDEPYFTIMGRDRVGSKIVRKWADEREAELRASDATCTPAEVFAELDQIAEARKIADEMFVYRDQREVNR